MTPLRFLKSFSLANLIFLPAWVEMAPGAGPRYFMGYTVGGLGLSALGINILLTALIINLGFYGLEQVPGKKGSMLRSIALFLLSGLAINGIRVSFQDQAYYFDLANQAIQLGWPKFLAIYGSPFIFLALFIHFRVERFRRWGAMLLLLLSPLALIQAASFWKTTTPQNPLPPAVGNATVTRPKGLLVFLIFDEWDYNWTFPFRPAHLHLPEVDRFAAENISFTHAYAPTNQTFRSIPSLLTGRVVEQARTVPGPDLMLKFRGESRWIPWSQVPDLPYQLGTQGLRTCFITHFHAFSPAYMRARPNLEIRRKPYFGEWEIGQSRYRTFGGSLVRQWRCILENLPGINFVLNHEGKVDSVPTVYLHALDETLEAIHSRSFDAIIVHWPIPHAPVIVDPTTGDFSAHPPKGLRLTENLLLVDKTIGRIRREMEADGLWKDATVVLTSDHWQRLAADPAQKPAPDDPGIEASQHRVPLLIKWPGNQGPHKVDTSFNVVGVFHFLAAPEVSKQFDLMATPNGYLGSYTPWIK
jgi:hypothetical protein